MRIVRLVLAAAMVAVMTTPALALMDRGDGIHTETWFLNQTTFYEMASEAEAAGEDGKKGLILVWEQEGCGSCLKLHEVNFQDAKLTRFLKANYSMMSMNIFGEMVVTDFDGQTKPEKDMAARLSVHRSPTTQFYTPEGEMVFELPGYLDPERYLAAALFVKEEGYKDESVNGNFLRWYADNRQRVADMYAAAG